MFSHIMVGANDIEASKNFYDAVLGVLGAKPGVPVPNLEGDIRYFYFLDGMIFAISEPIDGNPATHGNGSTIGFKVESPQLGDAWHAAGLDNGGVNCEDAPGIRTSDMVRTSDMGSMYLAYLRDPSGNKICALCRIEQ